MGHDVKEPGAGFAELTRVLDRRRWMQWFGVAVAGLAAAFAFVTPLVGYFLAPLLKPKLDEWLDIGAVNDFPIGQTRLVDYVSPNRAPWDGVTAKTACYVRRQAEKDFVIFAVNCTHLGCPVNWFPESGLFMCPCHGGVYYEDGAHASGPPPRGLYQYDWRIDGDRLFAKVGHLPTLQDTMKESAKKV
ncbi:MAG: Rieske (2Fe-2S) protein [Planctomycetota bacterium]